MVVTAFLNRAVKRVETDLKSFPLDRSGGKEFMGASGLNLG